MLVVSKLTASKFVFSFGVYSRVENAPFKAKNVNALTNACFQCATPVLRKLSKPETLVSLCKTSSSFPKSCFVLKKKNWKALVGEFAARLVS